MHPLNHITGKQICLVAHHPQQHRAALQARLIGKSANGFQHRLPDVTAALGFQALVFVQRVEHMQVIGHRARFLAAGLVEEGARFCVIWV